MHGRAPGFRDWPPMVVVCTSCNPCLHYQLSQGGLCGSHIVGFLWVPLWGAISVFMYVIIKAAGCQSTTVMRSGVDDAGDEMILNCSRKWTYQQLKLAIREVVQQCSFIAIFFADDQSFFAVNALLA